MLKPLAIAAALVGALATTEASAATVSITAGGGGYGAPASNNDFADELATAGFTLFGHTASFTLDAASKLTFTLMAAESSYLNSFSAVGAGTLSETSPGPGNVTFGEGDDFLGAGYGSISVNYVGGSLDSYFKFSSSTGPDAAPGSQEMGVFVTTGSSGLFQSKFFLAYDDNGAGPDDNHDDLIIRVDVSAPGAGEPVIPIPAALPLMAGGLGLMGFMGWRRKRTAA